MNKDKDKDLVYHYGLGRRKTSVAKVRLQTGKGEIIVNSKPAEDYFSGSEPLLHELKLPLAILGRINDFDISVLVKGGGHHSQVGAIRAGIAKALILVNPDCKDTLRRAKLLGRDPRAKERKKFGLRSARKKRQFTKR